MAGVKGMYIGPMPNWEEVEKQYQEFCKYRHEIKCNVSARRLNLFADRVFDGEVFEVE